MKSIHRPLLFGVLSGLAWCLVPGTLTEEWQSTGQTLSILAAGVLTGVVVSLILYRPLEWNSYRRVLALGVASLPLGAFVYGFTISILHLVIWQLTNVSYTHSYVNDQYWLPPIQTGLQYAGGSISPIFALFLVPVAITTTFLLRLVLTARPFRWQWRFSSWGFLILITILALWLGWGLLELIKLAF